MQSIKKLRMKLHKKSSEVETLKNELKKATLHNAQLLIENNRLEEKIYSLSKDKTYTVPLCTETNASEDAVEPTTNFSSFKKGETVLCVDNACSRHYLRVGDSYEILDINKFYARLNIGGDVLSVYEQDFVDSFKLLNSCVPSSSRFMPNVKFKVSSNHLDSLFHLGLIGLENQDRFIGYSLIDENLLLNSTDLFNKYGESIIILKEVSIYEAIPELVPEGMVYDKYSDSLRSKNIFDRYADGEDVEFPNKGTGGDFHPTFATGGTVSFDSMANLGFSLDAGTIQTFTVTEDISFDGTTDYLSRKDPISQFAKDLAITKPYNCSQIQWVVDTFGEEKTERIIDMCSTLGMDLMELCPTEHLNLQAEYDEAKKQLDIVESKKEVNRLLDAGVLHTFLPNLDARDGNFELEITGLEKDSMFAFALIEFPAKKA